MVTFDQVGLDGAGRCDVPSGGIAGTTCSGQTTQAGCVATRHNGGATGFCVWTASGDVALLQATPAGASNTRVRVREVQKGVKGTTTSVTLAGQQTNTDDKSSLHSFQFTPTLKGHYTARVTIA